MTTTGDRPAGWDPDFCCPWCPHQAPIRPLLAEHLTRCEFRPKETTDDRHD